MNKDSGGKPFLTLALALALVALVSLLPLNRWSTGNLKDFNLVSDILPDSLLEAGTEESIQQEELDPVLVKALADSTAVARQFDSTGTRIYTDTIIAPTKAPRLDSLVIIEDYTDGEVGLYHLRQALASGATARITVVGDSYIEGDIFTQNLRELFQDTYGGSGVGFVNMHSDFPGFRRSVKQGGKGWTEHGATQGGDPAYIGFSEHYFTPAGGTATSTYAGVTKLRHLDSWSRSTFLFIAPTDATVEV